MSFKMTDKDPAVPRAVKQSLPRRPTWLEGFVQSVAPTPRMSTRRGAVENRPDSNEHEDHAAFGRDYTGESGGEK